MAKEQPTPKEQSAERVALDEFCARLSENEKRYTLIAGFHASEVKARRLRDTSEAYANRFAAFLKQPA